MRQEDGNAWDEGGSHKTILVLEDDEAIGEVITLALSQQTAWYLPYVVADRDGALAVLSSQPVDLMLIDYHLARGSGLEVYDHLHAHEVFQTVPVIIMSASLERHEQELRERHLTGLKKPFDVEELLTLVKQAIG
jgi:DNA-binding response OmpR family regulator